LGLGVVPAVMVLMQPDLGTSSLFPVIGAVLLAWWGLPLWYFLLAAMPFVAMFFRGHSMVGSAAAYNRFLVDA